ncbi:hypothetical protein FM107_12305 [Sphingobacterium sp. JB170]|nr:hypothetical protein FM107_12305 [Sphingobacterium sp. JB170]
MLSSERFWIGAALENPEKHNHHHHNEQTGNIVLSTHRKFNQENNVKKRF